MNLILMGPPGAGKGTQADILTQRLGVKHLSTGDLLRTEVSEGTDLGREAKRYMDAGELVPDEVMINMILVPVLELVHQGSGFILDGFPRNAAQAQALDKAFKDHSVKIEAVVAISADEDEIVRRITGRLSCPVSGRIYHETDNPPKVAGYSDVDPSVELVRRKDDNEETIRKRLQVYAESTEPILNFYRKETGVIEIDGCRDKEVVTEDILSRINQKSETMA